MFSESHIERELPVEVVLDKLYFSESLTAQKGHETTVMALNTVIYLGGISKLVSLKTFIYYKKLRIIKKFSEIFRIIKKYSEKLQKTKI
jgi:hypothetical protein